MVLTARSPVSSFICALSLILVAALFLLFASPASALSATGQRVLIVTSTAGEASSKYSALSQQLEGRGFSVAHRAANGDGGATHNQLTEYDERRYDHIVFLADDVKKPTNDLSPQSLVDFNKAGGNIVFGYSPSRSDWFRDLAREFSLELAPAGHRLVDHFHQSKRDDRLVLLARSEKGESALVKDNAVFAGDAALAEEVKRGNAILAKDIAPHIVGDNPLAFPLVKPSSTSYLAGSDGQPLWLGTDKDLSIISAFQLRDSSARVAFIGSQDLLSDDVLLSSSSSSSNMNSALLTSLLTWTFQERSVLRIDRRTHYRVRSSPSDVREPYEEPAEGGSASMYRIKDNVRYAIDVAQHDPELGWIAAPKDLDLQVSLNMIDPFITVKLSAEDETMKSSLASQLPPAPAQSNITTRYSTTLRLPDRLGVYTFRLKWFRHGWTYFDDVKDVAPIRAFNHDEGERFLPASWPYAAASFSTVGGFLVFVVLWVLGGDEEVKRAKGE